MDFQRKRLQGTVTSDKMDKTVVVSVGTTKRHPVYGKVIKSFKKYMAHDEENACHVGDRVEILESRPMSRRKRWSVVEILERAQ